MCPPRFEPSRPRASTSVGPPRLIGQEAQNPQHRFDMFGSEFLRAQTQQLVPLSVDSIVRLGRPYWTNVLRRQIQCTQYRCERVRSGPSSPRLGAAPGADADTGRLGGLLLGPAACETLGPDQPAGGRRVGDPHHAPFPAPRDVAPGAIVSPPVHRARCRCGDDTGAPRRFQGQMSRLITSRSGALNALCARSHPFVRFMHGWCPEPEVVDEWMTTR